MLRGKGAREGFPPLQRVGIEMLACCEPAGLGLEMTHWSMRSLAKVAIERGLAPKIAHSTVSLILRAADLQPHRSRYWRTPTLNADFMKRAASVLWCYERASKLAKNGEFVLCLDEKPNLQVLERRRPTRPMRAGQIERREFEYIRHGTVNLLVALVVHTGRMRAWCLDSTDGEHLRAILPEVFRDHRRMRRIHLIWDGSPSHTAAETVARIRHDFPTVRVLFTPPHASWLNQAELLLRSFTAHYLNRGDWKSRAALVEHLSASWPEYNRLFAKPIVWSWTRQQMHEWVDRHRS
jgi:transposase